MPRAPGASRGRRRSGRRSTGRSAGARRLARARRGRLRRPRRGRCGALVLWLLPWYRAARVRRGGGGARHHARPSTTRSSAPAGFRLLGVHATAAALPGARAQAPEIDVADDRPAPGSDDGARRARLTLTGSWRTVDAALHGVAREPAGRTGRSVGAGDAGGRRVARGLAGRLRRERARRGLERAPRRDLARRVGHRARALGRRRAWPCRGASSGPGAWTSIARRGRLALRVALDPGVPDACTVLVVGDDERTTSVDVVIPRSPLARLGLPPVAARACTATRSSWRRPPTTERWGRSAPRPRRRAASTGSRRGCPCALDVSWDGSASGDSQSRARREEGAPGGGSAGGRADRHGEDLRRRLPRGPRLERRSRCRARPSTRPSARAIPFDVAFQLRKLAEGAGLAEGDRATCAPAGRWPSTRATSARPGRTSRRRSSARLPCSGSSS